MTDRQLQNDVQRALEWEPSIDAANIGVSADKGVVTLYGDAKSYAEKTTAERVTLGVYGVNAVANDINVRLGNAFQRNDPDIAQAAVSALRWNTVVPDDSITLTVSNGWVTLKGHVDWKYQSTAAADSVRDLIGVRGVTNAITIEPHVSAADVQSKIEEALKRSAQLDARRISVAVSNSTVTLTGNVHSWFERNEARRAAWSAPGVKDVDDRIAVVP